MNAVRCARCGRSLTARSERRVPAVVAATAAAAFAFLHAGMWAREALSRPFCARCVRLVVGLAVLLSAVLLAAASFGVALWLHAAGR